MKKALKIIGIILAFLWFGSNLALYLYLKTNLSKNIDSVPQKMQLMRSEFQAEQIYFENIAFKLPFEREDIETIVPGFSSEQLNGISIFLKKGKKVSSFTFGLYPNFLIKSGGSFFTYMQKSNYLRLKDYSWWNLPSNTKLGAALILKDQLMPPFNNIKIYDVEAAPLRWFCYEGTKKNTEFYNKCTFEYNEDKNYSFDLIGHNIDFLIQVRSMILASVQTISDIDYEHAILLANEKYINKHKSQYPEELLLLSLISVKDHRLDYMEELASIMEKKNYEKKHIDELNHSIKQAKEKINFQNTSEKE